MTPAQIRFMALQTESASARIELERAADVLERELSGAAPAQTMVSCWGCGGTGQQEDYLLSSGRPPCECPHCAGTGRLPVGSAPPRLTVEQRIEQQRLVEARIRDAALRMVSR